MRNEVDKLSLVLPQWNKHDVKPEIWLVGCLMWKMTNKGNIGILRILISSLFQYILNVQIGLWFWLKAFNIESRMLKRVISTRMTQFLSFCPVLPSVRPHEPSVRPHSWLMCTKIWIVLYATAHMDCAAAQLVKFEFWDLLVQF